NMRNSTGNTVSLGGLPNGILGPVGQDASTSSGRTSLSYRNNTVAVTIAPSFGIGSLNKKFSMGADKYIIEPSIRPELNSAYGSKMRVTVNPGLGLKWNFYAEPFMANQDWLSFGAIRGTWGRVTRFNANIYDIW